MKTVVYGIVTSVLAALVAGCATPSQPQAMIATSAPALHGSKETVAVSVSGGRETSSMGASQISDAAFAQALRDSIENSGLFAKAVQGSDAPYRLEAFIGKVQQPFLGFDATVAMEVSYTLSEAPPEKKVWQKSIETSYTATVSDALVGVTRLRLANEGAARKNIEQAIAELSKLGLH